MNEKNLGRIRRIQIFYYFFVVTVGFYEDYSECKERFAIQKYLLTIGKKQNMQVLSNTFTYCST